MICVGGLPSNISLVDLEMDGKKELDRRKKLRLLQVRQQSKDFTNKLRKCIQAEIIQQRNALFQSNRKQIKENQLEELNHLREKYETCIQTIGTSHSEAAKHPNLNVKKQAESKRNLTQATARGAMARKQQFERNFQDRYNSERPIKLRKGTRNKENLRSFFVSSLPTCIQRNEHPSKSPKKSGNQSSEPTRSPYILQEIPNTQSSNTPAYKFTDKESKKGIGNKRILNDKSEEISSKKILDVAVGSQNILEEDNLPATVSSNECFCDYAVCCCHDIPNELKRRCNSESRVTHGHSFELKEKEAIKNKTRSRSCSPHSVRTLNYCDVGNLYESNQPNFIRVTHHSTLPKLDSEKSIGDPLVDTNILRTIDHKESKKKTEDRSTKALKREQLKQNFQQLLHDLDQLTREKILKKSRATSKAGVYQRERDIIQKQKAKQRKLGDAFETLLHSANLCESLNTGSTHQVRQLESEDSSPPTLNLAIYEQFNMSSRGSSPGQPSVVRNLISSELTISQTSFSAPDKNYQSPPSGAPRTSDRSPKRSDTRSPSPPIRSPTTSSKPPPHSFSPSGPSEKQTPEVSIRTDPSGEVHLRVKITDTTKHKKKCKTQHRSPAMESSSSYLSPPENLTPSQKLLLDALCIQVNKKALNEDLKKYIKKLLTMSRESIDELNTSSSLDYIDPTRNPDKEIQEDIVKLTELTLQYADKVNTLADMYEQFDPVDQYFSSPQFIDLEPSPSAQHPSRIPPPPSKIPTPLKRPQTPLKTTVTRPPQQPSSSPASTIRQTKHSSLVASTHRQPAQPAVAGQTKGRQAPSPIQPAQPAVAGQIKGRQAPSPIQRVPRNPKTPPMQKRTRRPQSGHRSESSAEQVLPPQESAAIGIPKPLHYQSPQRLATSQAPAPGPQESAGIGIPTPLHYQNPQRLATSQTPAPGPQESAGIGIPTPPHYQSPQRLATSQTPAPGPRGIQSPFGLSMNLLPHPTEVFGQTDPAPQPQRTMTSQTPQQDLSPITESPERRKLPSSPDPSKYQSSDGESWDPFEGLPPPPKPIPGHRREVMSIIREYNPDKSTIKTFTTDETFDFERELEKHGLADDFKHIRDLIQPNQSSNTDNGSLTSEEDMNEQPILTLSNIRQRLSEVCNDHQSRLAEIFDQETDVKKKEIIKEVWRPE